MISEHFLIYSRDQKLTGRSESMKRNAYICTIIIMISLLCSGCGKNTKASVFELDNGQADAETVSAQESGHSQMSQEEWKALLEEALASLEMNPVIQVTCSCTGETQVQQAAVEEPVQAQTAQETADADGRVNINTADAAALQTLTGIGETRAQAIIAYRESCGNFQTIEDIMLVDGIKEGVFNKIKDEISVG